MVRTLAAQHGAPVAQYRLGLLYLNGTGVAQDLVTAHMWPQSSRRKTTAGGGAQCRRQCARCSRGQIERDADQTGAGAGA